MIYDIFDGMIDWIERQSVASLTVSFLAFLALCFTIEGALQ
jgi:hypothetical protein